MNTSKEEIARRLYNYIFMDESGCWIWQGRVNSTNRPIITFEDSSSGKRKVQTIIVHKYLYNEYFPTDIRYIDNTCGNLRCVNPEHQQARTFDVRFWENIVKDEKDCWIWQGPPVVGGAYGSVTIDGERCLVHRVSWEIYNNQKVPDGLMVCHRCNTPLCINPSHLYVGTHNDNMRDMANSDVMKGERNPKALLTVEQVKEIKQHIRERKIVYRKLAETYGVSRQAIKDIASGRTWGWVES